MDPNQPGNIPPQSPDVPPQQVPESPAAPPAYPQYPPAGAPPPPVPQYPPAGAAPPPYPQYPPQYPGQGYAAPGYPPAAYPYAQPGFPPPLPVQPIPTNIFSRMWDIVTHPDVKRLTQELEGANWTTIWVILLIFAAVEALISFAIFSLLGLVFASVLSSSSAPPGMTQVASLLAFPGSLFIAVFAAVAVPIAFYIQQGILWLLAKLFGGQGPFLDQAWLFSLTLVPFAVASLVGVIPYLGFLIALALLVYQIILTICMLAASHRMSVGRATAAVLIPLAIVLLGYCALIVVVITQVLPHTSTYPSGHLFHLFLHLLGA